MLKRKEVRDEVENLKVQIRRKEKRNKEKPDMKWIIEIMVISFDGVNEQAVDYVLDDKITCIAECNPLHGPRVSVVIELLEAGKTPKKFYYVNEEIFSANEVVKTIYVDGMEYDVDIISKVEEE